MVKLVRGGMHNSYRGRGNPRPLFPPGNLPLFGPPPAFMRRPGPPMPPPIRGFDYGPTPPPPMRTHLGPPMQAPPHIAMRSRPGLIRPHSHPPMPLLQAPVMPPRPLPFMRGEGMGHRVGPAKNLNKGIKKAKHRRNRKGDAHVTTINKSEEPVNSVEDRKEEDIKNGPLTNDDIKTNIVEMNDLIKKTNETINSTNNDLFTEQKTNLPSMSSSTKFEFIGSQPVQSVQINKDGEDNETGAEK